MNRAAFYIASNAQFADEARTSAASAKRWLPEVDTILLANFDAKTDGFDHFYRLPKPEYSGWYRNQTLYFNQAVEHLSAYDQLLYLDVDTYICRDCSGCWQILDHYDMAFGHAAGRGATPTAYNTPSEFCTLGIGVNFFRNTSKCKQFFEAWAREMVAHYDAYGETDEGPFRDLLFTNELDIRYFVLAPEEHCRFAFGVWLNGSVSILHGRANGYTIERVAQEINDKTSMRLYRPSGTGNGMLWHHPY